jgi:hypothetical protein
MGPSDVLLYEPFPYWTVAVLVMYRHNLSRLFHPIRDNGGLRNWWYVLGHIGLIDPKTVPRPGVKEEVLLYVACSVGAAGVSLSWLVRLFPLFWYDLALVQVVSGLILAAATVRYLGQPPRRPFVDVLRYPRLGSRIRHFPKVSTLGEGKREAQQPASTLNEEVAAK